MTEAADDYRRLLAAGEPKGSRPIGELVERLRASSRVEVVPPTGDGAGSGQPAVLGVTQDSRAVVPGTLFVAVPGEHVDGHDFAAEAVRRGSAALIVERRLDVPVPQVVVENAREAFGLAAAWWYGDPSARLGVIGVTGTDGKTSTSRLVAAVLEAAGWRSGIISTIGGRIGGVDEVLPPHVTTPQANDLQRALAAMVAAGDRAAVVETTSHGLALGRVAGVRYDVAVLTNVTHEHLDLHGTFEAYRDAKRSLFAKLAVSAENPEKADPGWPRRGVINADDPSAALFAATTRQAGAQVLTYGRSKDADLRLSTVEDDGQRLRIAWDGPDGRREAALRLAGRFNAWNALAAAGVGSAIGLDPEAVTQGLESLARVHGRMERVELGQPFGVVIDYAHSPNALAAVLDEVAPVARARGGAVIAVFGSGGERDVEKRGVMGRLAAENARLVIATNEDPRDEDPAAILEAIARGAEQTGAVRGESLLLIEDRRAAIERAFREARAGDVVLLAGKGHENTILLAGGEALPWDERAVATEALGQLGFSGPG